MDPGGAPKWWPDPFARAPYRWWDGERWTGYVAAGGDAVEWDGAPVEPSDALARGDAEWEPAPPGLRGVGVALAAFAVGVGLSIGVQLAIAATTSGETTPARRAYELLVSSLALWSGLVGGVVFVSRRRGTRSFARDFGARIRWSDVGYGLAASLVGRVIAGVAASPIPVPSRSIGDDERDIFNGAAHGTTGWLVLVVVVCIGAPVVEELFFRGLVQSRLVARYGVVFGLVVASLLFGAAHLIAWDGPLTLAYAWSVAAGGIVLGLTFHLTRRLGTSICAHALFNAQALLAVALLN
ncbi:MAG TPA: CPBP family glutamic-type intramembrane protease [Acidimicrobiales bacterium]|nr:CPBP family glutamic-type intramembrane protease [Acidimicrobiales bacterium]